MTQEIDQGALILNVGEVEPEKKVKVACFIEESFT